MTQEGPGSAPSIADLFKRGSQTKRSSTKESNEHGPEKEPNPKVCKALSFDSQPEQVELIQKMVSEQFAKLAPKLKVEVYHERAEEMETNK